MRTTWEAFLLTPRVLPLSGAEAGSRGHVTHLRKQVPIVSIHTAKAKEGMTGFDGEG